MFVPRASTTATPAVAVAPQTVSAPQTSTGDTGWTTPTLLETQVPTNDNLGAVALSADHSGMIVYEKDGLRNTIMATRFVPGAGFGGSDWDSSVPLSAGGCSNWAPSVAMDATGDAIAVWFDSCNYAIHAARFTPATGWSKDVGIDQPYWLSVNPQIAMNAAGTAIVAWEAWDGSRYHVFANRYVPGAGWGTAQAMDPTNNNATSGANVAIDAAGNGFVVWYRNDNNTYHVVAERFDATLGWLSPTQLVSTTTWAAFPTVSMDTAGNAIVAYVQWDGAYSIYADRYDAASATWSGTTAIESQSSWAFYTAPRVSASNGSAVVVWDMYGPGTDTYSVWANRYKAGVGWGAEVDLDGVGGTQDLPTGPNVALDRFGNATVVFQVTSSWTNPANSVDIRAVRYSALTGALSGYVALDGYRLPNGVPLIAVDRAGNDLVAWNYNDNTNAAPRNGILTQHYVLGTGWRGQQVAEWDQYLGPGWLQLESNTAGDAIFSWTQYDGPVANGYADLYTPAHGWSGATLIENLNQSSVQEEWSAIDSSGNAIVLFRIYDGVKYGVDAVYYSTTSGWGAPVRLSDDTLAPTDVYDNYWLRIAMDAHGDGLAVWEGWNGTAENLYADWFSGTTHAWAAPTRVPSPVSVNSASVGLDANGDAVVAWQAWDGTTYSVYASQYTAGTGWSQGALIEHSAMWAGAPYGVAINANGDAAVSWGYWAGSYWEAAVNTYTPGSGWGTEAILSHGPGDGDPAIPSVDGAGDTMLAYQLWDGTQWDVYTALRPAGGSWGTPVKLNAGTGDAVQIDTALDYRGNGFVAWTQYNGNGYDILSRRYVAGNGWLPVNVINSPAPAIAGTPTTPSTDSGNPIVAVDGHGDAVLGWNQWHDGALVPYAAAYTVGDGTPNLAVASPADGMLTSDANVTVSGTTDPGATLTVDGASVPVGLDGSFNVTYTRADGTHTFTIVATNAAGLMQSVTRTVTVDTTAPAVAITSPSSGLLTRDPVAQVSGTAEPGSTVVVNGVVASVSAAGQFSVAIGLHEGANNITATATDAAGNQGQASVRVRLDTTPPALSITSPADGANVSSPTVTVTGTTDPGASVVVNGQPVTVDASGSFAIQLTLSEGGNLITATATDAAGNAASTDVVVTYTNPVHAAQVQSSIASLDTMNLVLLVLVVVSLALGAFEMLQIRKLRSQAPPAARSPEPSPPPKKPEGGMPPTEEL